MRIAINGFGRIGRTFLRTLALDEDTTREVVVINVGPVEPSESAYFFKYDSVMGTFPGTVVYQDGYLTINEKKIKIIAEKDASRLPWHEFAIDWVVDCSGKYTKRDQAQLHLDAGAKNVLISAPGKDVDCTIIPGVNNNLYKKGTHHIVSLGSCTTNALMPLLKVIDEQWGIEHGIAVTTHAYTPSQALLDGFSAKDVRLGRAAALNIVPTSTGSDRMIGEIFPQLKGKVTATAMRVPVPKVSVVEMTWVSKKPLSADEINTAFVQAAQGSLQGIIECAVDPLVSCDCAGNNHSVIVAPELTVTVGTMNKISGWYDNEWGYSMRLRDFLITIA